MIFLKLLVYSIWLGHVLLEIEEPTLSDTDDELSDTYGEEDEKTDAVDDGTSSGT